VNRAVDLAIAFAAGFVAGLTFSEWDFTRRVRRACALASQEG
jgi:hypothetical protein